LRASSFSTSSSARTTPTSTATATPANLQTPNPQITNDGSNEGLKAGIGVLAALLALSLACIALLLWRRRRE
jgi:hypothetical protein